MSYDKKTFLKHVTILCDTNEQKNKHIKEEFDRMGINYKDFNLLFGDYSFIINDRDFSMLCVIERKASVDELYGNLTADRERIENEFRSASAISNQFTLLMEGIKDMEELRTYTVPDWQMQREPQRKVKEIGEQCYVTIQSWQSGNKYRFNTIFAAEKTQTATKILEHFYYYWRNFKILTANRRNRR